MWKKKRKEKKRLCKARKILYHKREGDVDETQQVRRKEGKEESVGERAKGLARVRRVAITLKILLTSLQAMPHSP